VKIARKITHTVAAFFIVSACISMACFHGDGAAAGSSASHLIETRALAPQAQAQIPPRDGIGAAIELDDGARVGKSPPDSDFVDVNASVRPHWCNDTATLIDDIHRRGGYSVMRAEIGGGRVLERYWNDHDEEVVIEHGSDGTSCLVDLRSRSRP